MKTNWIPIMTIFLALVTVTASAADYRVKRGDSLAGIARRNGTTVTELRAGNGLEGDIIRPGQVLKLPTKPSSPRIYDRDGTHLVKRGETLWSISRLHRVTVTDLKTLNNLKHPEKLKVGSKLLLHRAPAIVTSTASINAVGEPRANSVEPTTVPQVLPPKSTASSDQSVPEAFRSILLNRDESVGALALRHGMTAAQINSVNGWDYDADTLLAAGSEVHVLALEKQ